METVHNVPVYFDYAKVGTASVNQDGSIELVTIPSMSGRQLFEGLRVSFIEGVRLQAVRIPTEPQAPQ